MSKATDIVNEELKIDLTPMIDVTFQLLIFFMCTLHFKTMEGMLDCYLPKDIGVFSAPSKRNPEEPIYIRLLKSGEEETVVWIGDSKLKGKEKFESLFSRIDTIIQKTPNSPVIIDPEINVVFQDIISTLNACQKVQKKSYGKNLQIKFSAKALSDK